MQLKSSLTPFIATALLAMAVTGFAQSDGQSAQPAEKSTDQSAQPTGEQTNHKDPADKSKGQDLVNPNQSDPNPTTVGQDKSAGNNLVEPKVKAQAGMDARPDFKTIDMKSHGYVLASDVHNPWLKQNFSKCDGDGDGKVTKTEYETCAKQ